MNLLGEQIRDRKGLLPLRGIFNPSCFSLEKKLSAEQQRAIILHLEGHSFEIVAQILGKSPRWVYHTIKLPKAQEVIKDFESYLALEFRGLGRLAISALRKGLLNDDPKVALSAVEKFLRICPDLMGEKNISETKDYLEGIMRSVSVRVTVVDGQSSTVVEVDERRPPALEVSPTGVRRLLERRAPEGSGEGEFPEEDFS